MRYTEEQILKVQDRLIICNRLNTKIGSNCKISNLKILADEIGNIFITFVSETLMGDKDYKTLYFEYDREGNETVLNRAGFTTEELESMFSKLKEITL